MRTDKLSLKGTYVDPKIPLDYSNFDQDRRLVPMDRRFKTRMCVYGSCRNEFLVHDYGGGMKLYCDNHRHMALKIAQKKYRNAHPGMIEKRNAEFRKNNPDYARKMYLKNREKNLKYARDYRARKKAEKNNG